MSWHYALGYILRAELGIAYGRTSHQHYSSFAKLVIGPEGARFLRSVKFVFIFIKETPNHSP